MKFLYLLLISLIPLILNAQKYRNRETEINTTFNFSPVLNAQSLLVGLGLDIEAPVGRQCFSGASFMFTEGGVNNSYGYNTTDPHLTYLELGWINEYRFLNTKLLKLNLSLNNSTSLLELGDGNHKTILYQGKYSTWDHSKSMAYNFYYSIQPGFNISLLQFKKKSAIDHLFLKVNYNFMFGLTQFTGRNDYEMFTIAFGIKSW